MKNARGDASRVNADNSVRQLLPRPYAAKSRCASIERSDRAPKRIENEDSPGRTTHRGDRARLEKKNSEQAQEGNCQITGPTIHKSSLLP